MDLASLMPVFRAQKKRSRWHNRLARIRPDRASKSYRTISVNPGGERKRAWLVWELCFAKVRHEGKTSCLPYWPELTWSQSGRGIWDLVAPDDAWETLRPAGSTPQGRCDCGTGRHTGEYALPGWQDSHSGAALSARLGAAPYL